MPRTALTVTTVSRTGTTQPAQQNSDVANGNVLNNNTGGVMLEVQNSNAASRTVTVGIPGLVDGLTVGSGGRVVTVTGTTTVVLGPFPIGIYNQSDGSVNFDCSGVAGDIKFRAYQIF